MWLVMVEVDVVMSAVMRGSGEREEEPDSMEDRETEK